MKAIAALSTVTMAGVLLWSGLEKLRSPRPFKETMNSLDIPVPASHILAMALPLAESLTGAALILFPAKLFPKVGVLALASIFTLAGALGLRATEHIQCSCFGPGQNTLGWRQLFQLPAWLLGIGAVTVAGPPWAPSDGGRAFVYVILALCGIRAVQTLGSARSAGQDRRALDESAGQPHPIFAAAQEGTPS